MLVFVLTLLHDCDLQSTWNQSQITFTLTFLDDLDLLSTGTYSRLSGMFENHTIESNIIEVGQVVPEICHFLYFPCITAAILDLWPYKCLKMCNLRFLFSS